MGVFFKVKFLQDYTFWQVKVLKKKNIAFYECNFGNCTVFFFPHSFFAFCANHFCSDYILKNVCQNFKFLFTVWLISLDSCLFFVLNKVFLLKLDISFFSLWTEYFLVLFLWNWWGLVFLTVFLLPDCLVAYPNPCKCFFFLVVRG